MNCKRSQGARRVRDGHGTGQMFIEGKRLAVEAMRSGLDISECFVSERFVASSENGPLLESIIERARHIFELPDRLFYTIAATENTQGIALIADRPAGSSRYIEERLAEGKCLPVVRMLFEVNNPSNVGAILRTAEAANVAGVVVTKHSTDVYSPKALRAAMGAAFRLPVWTDLDFESGIKWAKDRAMTTTAATAHEAVDYTTLDWTMPRMLILGSEAHGLRSQQLESVVERTRISMDNGVESLNVAVAAGVFLYEAKRQCG